MPFYGTTGPIGFGQLQDIVRDTSGLYSRWQDSVGIVVNARAQLTGPSGGLKLRSFEYYGEAGYYGHVPAFCEGLGAEPSLMVTGTAFVVDSRTVATAAHVIDGVLEEVNGGTLADLRIAFGYRFKPSGTIGLPDPKADIYRVKRVYRNTAEDWALLEVDGSLGRTSLPLATGLELGGLRVGNPLYMIGHPLGMPLKYTTGGQVFALPGGTRFHTQLDGLAGNSGSPVFSGRLDKVVGMFVSSTVTADVAKHPDHDCTWFHRVDPASGEHDEAVLINLIDRSRGSRTDVSD
ncbi:trypsin-like peptidase domain-containing protein [Archangium minus]|uniref:Serine protease n=1 Tax=Archangium minus TaxID=83450 RepID=A0ABY9WPW6_9BACT|nr:trypsin-like peptidase domain-containing protein [Archangium minus]